MAGAAIEIADDQWDSEVLRARIPVLVDFWGAACPPCRTLAPTIEKLAGDLQGRVKVVKVNTDQYIGVASRLRISAVPAVLIYKDGQEVHRMLGARPEAKYREALCANAGVC